MSLIRRILLSSLSTFIVGTYQHFVVDVATPMIQRCRTTLISFFQADSAEPIAVDLALFLCAAALLGWICYTLRNNWFFQWLWQIGSFCALGYCGMITWQMLLFMITLAVEIYPHRFDQLIEFMFAPAEEK